MSRSDVGASDSSPLAPARKQAGDLAPEEDGCGHDRGDRPLDDQAPGAWIDVREFKAEHVAPDRAERRSDAVGYRVYRRYRMSPDTLTRSRRLRILRLRYLAYQSGSGFRHAKKAYTGRSIAVWTAIGIISERVLSTSSPAM